MCRRPSVSPPWWALLFPRRRTGRRPVAESIACCIVESNTALAPFYVGASDLGCEPVQRDAADLLVDALAALGVEYVFGVPGGAIEPLYNALARSSRRGGPQAIVALRIAGADDEPLPAGQIGEVQVRGDSVMSGYWNNPEATAAALRGGWLHTGDLGSLDERGLLTLKDRFKDVIISGGVNIYPREVEEVLLQHPAVSEVAVFGRGPHSCLGAQLARLELTTAYAKLVDELPGLRLGCGYDEVPFALHPVIRSIASLPLEFDAS